MGGQEQRDSAGDSSAEDFPYLIEYMIAGAPLSESGGLQMMRWHENLRFLYVLEGRAEIHLLDGVVSLATGQGAFINQNVIHLVKAAEVCYYCCISFPAYFLEFYGGGPVKAPVETLVESRQLTVYVFDGRQDWHGRVLAHLCMLCSLEEEKPPLYSYEVMVQLVNMWLEMQKHIVLPPRKRESVKCARMRKFLYYIGQHYREEVSLEELAASAGVSKSECLRCFKQSLGTTPYKYFMYYRLAKAADLLRNTDRQVSEIAILTGFEQSSYFGKCFRERLGCTPKEYRRRYLPCGSRRKRRVTVKN